MSTYRGVNACLAYCLNSVLNVKVVVAAFNQEKALVGAFLRDCTTSPINRFAALVKWKRTPTNTIVCKVVLSADSAGREGGD